MTIAEWRDKTVEGGFTDQKNDVGFPMSLHELLLSPLAWQAVGKVEGWGGNQKRIKYYLDREGGVDEALDFLEDAEADTASYYMHRMIDSLADGKTIEQYLETL